jgi:quercetin dioxygenase-like cupin family protein
MKTQNLKQAELSEEDTKAFHGLKIFPLTPDENGPFSALLLTLTPNTHLPEIYHQSTFEFFYVLRGTASGKLNGKMLTFNKGEYAYLPPGTTHDLSSGDAELEALAIFSPPLNLKKPDVVKV